MQRTRGGLVVVPGGPCVERPRLVCRALFGELEGPVDPPFDELRVRFPLPHPVPPDGLERKLGMQVRRGAADLDRFLHRGPEGLAVELERVRLADPVPELRLPAWVGLELERPVEQGQALVDLVAPHGQVGRAP
jgi:hypothetical protein